MDVGSVNNIYYNPDKKMQPPEHVLDKDAFLKLLVAQMRYQNPLEPKGSDEFISQVVQLTSMEQMINLSKNMEMLLRAQELSLSANLVGKHVVVGGPDHDATGTVERIIIGEDGIKLVIDGKYYDYGTVKEIGC
jgi:flagellar basal-body rod modification protein FlgD